MFGFFKRKSLEHHIHEAKDVYIKGVKFTIKKINLLNYMDGSNLLVNSYDTHKSGNAKAAINITQEKIKKYYSQVIMASVLKPKLSWKKEEPGIFVDDLFIDGDLVDQLYFKIIEHTYGKKKAKQLTSPNKELSKLIE